MRGVLAVLVVSALLGLCLCSEAQEDEPSFFSVIVDGSTSASETDPLAFDSLSITALYEVFGFAFQGLAGFSASGFDSLSFGASGKIGEIGLSSSLAFNPASGSFVSWRNAVTFSLLDVAVTNTFFLAGTQTEPSYYQLALSGEADGVSLDTSFKFETCCMCFLEAKVEAGWEWVECGIEMNSSAYFTKDEGFSYFTLSMKGIRVLPDMEGAIEPLVDLEYRFTTELKELTPTLRLEATQWWSCPECYILGELVWTDVPLEASGVAIYGLVCEFEFENGVSATFSDSFTPDKNSAVTGYDEFFELWQFGGPLEPCCGPPGSWELGIYFLDHPLPTPLFGWGMTSFAIDTSLSDQLSITADIELRPLSPHWKLVLGFQSIW